MKWYLAKLVYQIICGEGDHKPQFDEQLRLICGENDLSAFQKARVIGHREEETFLNNAQKLVHWKFIDVSELHPLNNLTDGAEIYSRVYEEDDAGDYIRIIQMRAEHVLENSFTNITV